MGEDLNPSNRRKFFQLCFKKSETVFDSDNIFFAVILSSETYRNRILVADVKGQWFVIIKKIHAQAILWLLCFEM